MANITITVPDNVANRLLDAIALEYRYTENQLQGETKAQFAKRMLIEDWAKRILKRQEGNAAAEASRATAEAAANSDVSIT